MAHRTKPKGKGAIRKWNREHKSGAKPLTDKDKNDIRKESETAKLPKKFKLAGESNLSKEEFNKKYGVKENKNKLKKKSSKPNLVQTPSPTWGVKKKQTVKGQGPVKDADKYSKTVKDHSAKLKAKKDADDKEWLQKTSRSPAARAGLSNEQRLAARQRHKDFKEGRAKAKADRKAGVKKKRKLKITKWSDLE